MIRGISSVVAGLPLPLVADALDEVLVEVADIEVSHLQRHQRVVKRGSLPRAEPLGKRQPRGTRTLPAPINTPVFHDIPTMPPSVSQDPFIVSLAV